MCEAPASEPTSASSLPTASSALQDALFPRALELTGAKDGKAFSNSDATIRAWERLSIVVTTYF